MFRGLRHQWVLSNSLAVVHVQEATQLRYSLNYPATTKTPVVSLCSIAQDVPESSSLLVEAS